MASKPHTREHCREMQELAVYGFMRRYHEIPDDLKQLCLSFYFILVDKWNKEISHASFTIDNETGQLIAKQNVRERRHAFGSFIVKKGDIQTWKIKITNKTPDVPNRPKWMNGRIVNFGIVEYKRNDQALYSEMRHFFHASDTIRGYGYCAYNGNKLSKNRSKAYGIKCKKDDILSMTLDLTQSENDHQGTLSFMVNDEPLGIAFDDIDINEEYCMAAAILWSDNLQLVQ